MHTMDENLVGYLLDALDEDTRRETDAYLRTHPEARRKLDLLRTALAPLEDDRAEEDPPPGLVRRTLACVAEANRTLPQAPRSTVSPILRGAWRRSEVIAASILALVVFGMGAAWVAKSARQAQVAGCQDNLREIRGALVQYSMQREDGALPRIEEKGPRSFAGMFVPILAHAGVLTEKVRLLCPACGGEHAPPSADPNHLRLLEEWYENDRPRFDQAIANLAGSYAYSLGYRDEHGLHGLRVGAGMDKMPIVADRPPFTGQDDCENGNSKNHGRKGQNVLFVDGSVQFITTRTLGGGEDDIYLNQDRLILAGVHQNDSVLGASDVSP